MKSLPADILIDDSQAEEDILSTGLVKKTEAERMAEVDWDFTSRVNPSAIEGLHPYPAKFVGELPRALLERLPVPTGTAVLDPFCGSGTTLVECQKRGIPAVGIDLNPIACLMSRVKTSAVPDGILSTIASVAAQARETSWSLIPNIPNLDHWFEEHVQKAIAALTKSISKAPSAEQELLRLALSSIIVRVSNQESDTRYAAISKAVTKEDVFVAFERAALQAAHALLGREYTLTPVDVIEADTLSVSDAQVGHNISLVITSPPYPNAYEYWLYHKYRMWWLGLDPLAVKEREIGARAHFFGRNHHTADDFVRQMTATFKLLKSVMIAGGYACFVVGRSKIHGKIIDNALIVEEAGASVGFERVFATERTLSPNRKSFNLSHANIKTETVLVMRLG